MDDVAAGTTGAALGPVGTRSTAPVVPVAASGASAAGNTALGSTVSVTPAPLASAWEASSSAGTGGGLTTTGAARKVSSSAYAADRSVRSAAISPPWFHQSQVT